MYVIIPSVCVLSVTCLSVQYSPVYLFHLRAEWFGGHAVPQRSARVVEGRGPPGAQWSVECDGRLLARMARQ